MYAYARAFGCIPGRLAIISMATLRWCAFTLSKESVFSIVTDTIPLPFVILDEVSVVDLNQKCGDVATCPLFNSGSK